ncbi:hypothetical protein MUA04_20640 [Enterobacteriaceae bacterium H11S18]|nr:MULTISPECIES: hypothetical protein [Enterobacteriaceae]MCT4712582.1 hypothetical protein [Dryocola clanedunensis]
MKTIMKMRALMRKARKLLAGSSGKKPVRQIAERPPQAVRRSSIRHSA